MSWHLNLHMQFKLLNSLADTVWGPLALPIQLHSNLSIFVIIAIKFNPIVRFRLLISITGLTNWLILEINWSTKIEIFILRDIKFNSTIKSMLDKIGIVLIIFSSQFKSYTCRILQFHVKMQVTHSLITIENLF